MPSQAVVYIAYFLKSALSLIVILLWSESRNSNYLYPRLEKQKHKSTSLVFLTHISSETKDCFRFSRQHCRHNLLIFSREVPPCLLRNPGRTNYLHKSPKGIRHVFRVRRILLKAAVADASSGRAAVAVIGVA